MIDQDFILNKVHRGQFAIERAGKAFSNLSTAQINWNPSGASWSIAECLEHLIIEDSAYFQLLEKIISGNFTMSLWERYSPLSSALGKLFKKYLEEKSKRKIKTNKRMTPPSSEKSPELINEYTQNLDSFLSLISQCNHIDLDKTIITSPVVSFITYSLRDAIHFQTEHEHRHIGQGIKVKEQSNFPKSSD